MLDGSCSGVVRSHRQVPVAELIVQIAQITGGGMRRHFRVLAFIDPPALLQTIFPAREGHELPHPASASLRHCLRQERALRLGQIDQVLRHALLLQDALHHCSISPSAPKSGFDDRTASRRLEIIQVRKDGIVDGEREIVRNCSNFALRAPAKVWIELLRLRNRFLGDLIDWRGCGFLFLETVAVTESLEFVLAYGVNNAAIQVVQSRVRLNVEAARQQLVEGPIELFPRLSEVSGAKIELACIEGRLALRCKQLCSIRSRKIQRQSRPMLFYV